MPLPTRARCLVAPCGLVAQPHHPRRAVRAAADAEDAAAAGLGELGLVHDRDGDRRPRRRRATLAGRAACLAVPPTASAKTAGVRSPGGVLTQSRVRATAAATTCACSKRRGRAPPAGAWSLSTTTSPGRSVGRLGPVGVEGVGAEDVALGRRRGPASASSAGRASATEAALFRQRAAAPAARRTAAGVTSAPRPTSTSTGALSAPLVGTVAVWPALPVKPSIDEQRLELAAVGVGDALAAGRERRALVGARGHRRRGRRCRCARRRPCGGCRWSPRAC